MRRASSTSRFSAGLLALCFVVGGPAAAALGRPFPCLPPVFDGGQRLHDVPIPRIHWFQILLRQHELCWRRPARRGEVRVELFGNSSVFGFPLPVEQTFAHVLNQSFAANGTPAHVFNLASLYTCQLRDAALMHDAVRYDPDLILYPVTLADFVHGIPGPGEGLFLNENLDTVSALLADPPPGLAEPLEMYRDMAEAAEPIAWWELRQLKQLGPFFRTGAALYAVSIVRSLAAEPARRQLRTLGRQTQYDCELTKDQFGVEFDHWRSWNILAYLEELHRSRGVEVLVVNWPVAHEPVGDCYNVRYPNAGLAEFRDWVREETRARGLAHLDLQDLLPADEFIDSLHVTAAGHARIAAALGPIVRTVAARRATTSD